jgi:magnesium chelatase family protein
LVARERQLARSDRCANAELDPELIETTEEVERMLADARDATGLSGRGRVRVLRVARTLADLDQSEKLSTAHLAEALSLRRREPG